MIDLSTNSNSIYISIVSTGCFKVEFDSTYPIHLNGIINPEEFQQSISRINQAASSNRSFIIFEIISGLCLLGGIVCFIVGGIISVNSSRNGFPALVGVGFALFAFGVIFLGFGCFIIQHRRSKKIRRAISEESIKYSSRSPIPCSWRLVTSRSWFGRYGYHNNQVVYHLVIDIGRSTAPQNSVYYSNQIIAESASNFERQNNYDPPPYVSSLTGYCSKCGAMRSIPTAKFCSQCGHLFNKY